MMKHFGIIGYPLEHSFSANFFNKKFKEEGLSAEYSLYPLRDIREFPALLSCKEFVGMNVTMPYKQSIIPYLDTLDETAKDVNAVNVIHFTSDGKKIGYNTDAIGFMQSFKDMFPAEIDLTNKQALIIGTGGAAKAVSYGLKKLGMQSIMVSRNPKSGQLGYQDLTPERMQQTLAIINCTPLGMVPNVDAFPAIPYHLLTEAHYLYDCIYNPQETEFLRKGKGKGCVTKNGMEMLLGQARAAWTIWEKT